jgi:hypothetical protein
MSELSMDDAAEIWRRIRATVEIAAKEYQEQYGHPLCPWSFDATELPAAMDYIGNVVAGLPLARIATEAPDE